MDDINPFKAQRRLARTPPPKPKAHAPVEAISALAAPTAHHDKLTKPSQAQQPKVMRSPVLARPQQPKVMRSPLPARSQQPKVMRSPSVTPCVEVDHSDFSSVPVSALSVARPAEDICSISEDKLAAKEVGAAVMATSSTHNGSLARNGFQIILRAEAPAATMAPTLDHETGAEKSAKCLVSIETSSEDVKEGPCLAPSLGDNEASPVATDLELIDPAHEGEKSSPPAEDKGARSLNAQLAPDWPYSDSDPIAEASQRVLASGTDKVLDKTVNSPGGAAPSSRSRISGQSPPAQPTGEQNPCQGGGMDASELCATGSERKLDHVSGIVAPPHSLTNSQKHSPASLPPLATSAPSPIPNRPAESACSATTLIAKLLASASTSNSAPIKRGGIPPVACEGEKDPFPVETYLGRGQIPSQAISRPVTNKLAFDFRTFTSSLKKGASTTNSVPGVNQAVSSALGSATQDLEAESDACQATLSNMVTSEAQKLDIDAKSHHTAHPAAINPELHGAPSKKEAKTGQSAVTEAKANLSLHEKELQAELAGLRDSLAKQKANSQRLMETWSDAQQALKESGAELCNVQRERRRLSVNVSRLTRDLTCTKERIPPLIVENRKARSDVYRIKCEQLKARCQLTASVCAFDRLCERERSVKIKLLYEEATSYGARSTYLHDYSTMCAFGRKISIKSFELMGRVKDGVNRVKSAIQAERGELQKHAEKIGKDAALASKESKTEITRLARNEADQRKALQRLEEGKKKVEKRLDEAEKRAKEEVKRLEDMVSTRGSEIKKLEEELRKLRQEGAPVASHYARAPKKSGLAKSGQKSDENELVEDQGKENPPVRRRCGRKRSGATKPSRPGTATPQARLRRRNKASNEDVLCDGQDMEPPAGKTSEEASTGIEDVNGVEERLPLPHVPPPLTKVDNALQERAQQTTALLGEVGEGALEAPSCFPACETDKTPATTKRGRLELQPADQAEGTEDLNLDSKRPCVEIKISNAPKASAEESCILSPVPPNRLLSPSTSFDKEETTKALEARDARPLADLTKSHLNKEGEARGPTYDVAIQPTTDARLLAPTPLSHTGAPLTKPAGPVMESSQSKPTLGGKKLSIFSSFINKNAIPKLKKPSAK
ncbi:hypothetical protein Naga_100016g41 [Nannochloropsis gaditana]|uniref:Uncharacterized protein n=1 Tax=Nannochloropsis gaditana TaxID=72520 RepID=W7TWV4_9STRA|nr:hypothetical protein Naga_100016g41 [Nannochloropsis gaditana]